MAWVQEMFGWMDGWMDGWDGMEGRNGHPLSLIHYNK